MLKALSADRVEPRERAVDVQIMRLRRKIETDPSHPVCILTERGIGYCFNAPVEKVY